MNRIISLFVLLCIVVIALAFHTHAGRTVSQVRRCCDGEVWLSMSKPERHSFVVGFIYGVQHGHKDGCTDYDDLARPEFHVKSPEEIPISKCMQRELQFGKPFEFYENRLTMFYEKYPKDRDVPFSVVFAAISDGENQSDEKIHTWMTH